MSNTDWHDPFVVAMALGYLRPRAKKQSARRRAAQSAPQVAPQVAPQPAPQAAQPIAPPPALPASSSLMPWQQRRTQATVSQRNPQDAAMQPQRTHQGQERTNGFLAQRLRMTILELAIVLVVCLIIQATTWLHLLPFGW